MPPETGVSRRVKLSALHEWSVYLVAIGVTLSGIAWLYLHYFAQVRGEFGVQTNPLEPWSLKIHGAFGALALVLIGSLLTIHVMVAIASRRHLISGISLLSFWSVLSLTGYLLYYAGSENFRAGVSLVHWVVGLGLPLILLIHLTERRWRKRLRQRRSPVL
jgi:hypothetical protein